MGWSLHCCYFRGTSKTGHWCCVLVFTWLIINVLSGYCDGRSTVFLTAGAACLKIVTSTDPQMWMYCRIVRLTAVAN